MQTLRLTRFSFTLAALALLAMTPPAAVNAADPPPETLDGLVRVQDSKVALAYVDPEADFATETLSENGGYGIVEEAGEDVLLVRPAIIDLDVTAPDTMSAGRSYTFASNAGEATLVVELSDSVTGDLLARAADRRASRDNITLQWTTRVSNRADAKRLMKHWATLLRDAMDEVHGGGE